MSTIRAKWLYFKPMTQTKTRKTKVWLVLTLYGETLLGQIRWHAAWRKYAFFPEPRTLFEPDCLDDLASFLRGQTKARQYERRQEKLAKAPPEVQVFTRYDHVPLKLPV